MELIIVIAIMAILVAILAPQFLKYVERSRNAADIANAKKMTDAIEAYLIDQEANGEVFKEGVSWIYVENDRTEFEGPATNYIIEALHNAGLTGITRYKYYVSNHRKTTYDIKCKSKQTWDRYQVQLRLFKDGRIGFYYEAWHNGVKHVPAFEDALCGVSNNDNPSGKIYD